MRPHGHESIVEGRGRPHERLEARRPGDVGERRERVRVVQRERPERGHVLGAVDEREALLRGEHHRGEPGACEGRAARFVSALGAQHLAFADEDEREVRERREIARGPDGALGGHARDDVVLEQADQQIDDLRTHTRVPHRDDLRPEKNHGPNLGTGEIGPDAARVTPHEVALQGGDVALRDARLGEGAKAGVHTVHSRPVVTGRRDAVDWAARRLDASARLGAERDGSPRPRHPDEVGEGDGTTDEDRGRVRARHSARTLPATLDGRLPLPLCSRRPRPCALGRSF